MDRTGVTTLQTRKQKGTHANFTTEGEEEIRRAQAR